MTKMDNILILGTFAMGVVTGVFFFIVVFKPTYLPELTDKTAELAEEFSVSGTAKLADGTTSSFRLIADRSFTYFPPGLSETALRGRLPSALFDDTQTSIKNTQLLTASGLRNYGECQVESETTTFAYNIIVEQSLFALDTCLSSTEDEVALDTDLKAIWIYFNDPTAYNASEQESGSSLERWLQKKLEGDD